MIPPRYKIGRNASCPCGSGKKYKKCCQLFINTGIRDRATELQKAGNYRQAVLAYRAWATQYKIWHEEHTVPFFRARPSAADDLMIVDIQAVISIYSSLSHCLMMDGRPEEIDEVLQRISAFIDDDRYRFCLVFLRALRFAITKEFDSATAVLQNAPVLQPERLVSFEYGRVSLRLFVDLLWTQLPLERNLRILDCLLSSEEDPLLTIEDRVHKGLLLYVYKDRASSLDLLQSAVDLAQTAEPKNAKQRLQLHLAIARAHEQMAFIHNSHSEGQLALDEYQKVVNIVDDDNEALASLHQSIGHVHDFMDDFRQAQEHFDIANRLSSNNYILMDLSRAKALLGKLDEALEWHARIDKGELDEHHLIDYYSVLAQVAIQKEDRDLATSVDVSLSKIRVELPVLNDLRNEIRLGLMRMLSQEEPPKKHSKPFLLKTREAINRIFLLQPNFFGLGLNLNNLIEPRRTSQLDKKRVTTDERDSIRS